jgi:hypothetical protein
MQHRSALGRVVSTGGTKKLPARAWALFNPGDGLVLDCSRYERRRGIFKKVGCDFAAAARAVFEGFRCAIIGFAHFLTQTQIS